MKIWQVYYDPHFLSGPTGEIMSFHPLQERGVSLEGVSLEMDLIEGKKAEPIIGRLTEMMPGRPTMVEHRHPFDDIRKHHDKHSVHPLTRLHVLTITTAEQQTMNFYMNVGNRYLEPIARGLYEEIGQIEEQHVTQYESLLDPLESWFEQELFHHTMSAICTGPF